MLPRNSGLRSEDVVRIEVLRGEQSALYGSDAVGGVINIITRAGEIREQWRASVEAGSRETLEGQFTGIIPLGRASLSINGNAFNTEGFDISGQNGEKDGADSRRLSIGLNRVEVGSVTVSANGAVNLRKAEFDEDSDFDGRLNNTNGVTDVKTTTARVDARFTLARFDHLIQSGKTPVGPRRETLQTFTPSHSWVKLNVKNMNLRATPTFRIFIIMDSPQTTDSIRTISRLRLRHAMTLMTFLPMLPHGAWVQGMDLIGTGVCAGLLFDWI